MDGRAEVGFRRAVEFSKRSRRRYRTEFSTRRYLGTGRIHAERTSGSRIDTIHGSQAFVSKYYGFSWRIIANGDRPNPHHHPGHSDT